jgi:hypothetical protein
MTSIDTTALLDLTDPGFDPYGSEVAAARAANWYAHTTLGIAVLGRPQITALLADRRLRQGTLASLVARGISDGPVYEWMRSIILNVEGSDHSRLRRLVSTAFTPRAVTALRPQLRVLANEYVDGFASHGQCEFMAAFAGPFPSAAICELLGVPAERREAVRGWAEDLGLIFSSTAPEHHDRIAAAIAGLDRVADELIALRRVDPQPDLLSALVTAESDGDRLSAAELRMMVSGLVFGGQDTTRNQLGLAMHTFAGRPDLWSQFAAQPELVPGAVEEVLRAIPVIPVINRLVSEDLSLDGLDLPAGTLTSLIIAGSYRDPADASPTEFDMHRSEPAPLAFGGGIHYCLGAALARAELNEALPVLAARLPGLRLAGEPTWRPAVGITGPVTLPIAFDVPASGRPAAG